jgi:hypothetical protein
MTSVIATVIRAVWLQSCPNVPSTQATIKLFTKHNDKKPTIMYDIYKAIVIFQYLTKRVSVLYV